MPLNSATVRGVLDGTSFRENRGNLVKWAWKDGDTVTCCEITHDGEGERGRSVEVLGVPNAGSHSAEHAAEYFDELEKQGDRDLTDSDLDRTSRVVEVVGVYDRPARYRVACRVERRYEATAMDGAQP